MKTSLLVVAVLSVLAAAAVAADAPANAPAAAENPKQKQCDQIDADLTKIYATHKGLMARIKASGLLNHRKSLKCPGNPPAPSAKK